MAKTIYGIEEFETDDRYWRVAWIAGTKRDPRVPTEPCIQVLLAALPDGETDPLSRTSLRSSVIRQKWIGVGQLPYISIGSVWHNTKPVRNPHLSEYATKLEIDTSSVQFVSLGDLAMKHHAIPKSHYLFAGNYPHAGQTQVAALKLEDDPWAVLIPVAELLRFYYASSTRLAQALFWGVYAESINAEKCGQTLEGPYRVHLRKRFHDTDAWTLARFHASHHMQQQVQMLYRGIQQHHVDSPSINPGPFQALRCGFPFADRTTIEAIALPMPSPTRGRRRVLVLKLLRCSAQFPFGDLLCDRDNQNLRGKEAGDENLPEAWRLLCEKEDEEQSKSDDPAKNNFHSDSEPSKLGQPLVVDLFEKRFTDLEGRKFIKEPPEVQKYRSAAPIKIPGSALEGFGTGEGIWSNTGRKPAQINTNVDPSVLGKVLISKNIAELNKNFVK